MMLIELILSGFFTFVELNCENLFDCSHDSLKNDEEFLPDSYRHWNTYKYWNKLNHIGQEIIACGEEGSQWDLPDMVALCEVENDTVMRDLTRRSLLRGAVYDYIMTNSPDVRGIDVALLYSPFSFRLLKHYPLRVEPIKNMRPTRDILYAEGQLIDGDTLHVFVVHAPSRAGGELTTRPHRMQVCRRLCQSVDSVTALHPQARIIIAGDFNDGSNDKSLMMLKEHGLEEVSEHASGSNGARGTYKYKGVWGSLDHIFCSKTQAAKLAVCQIKDSSFLLEDDGKYGGVKPLRTFYGPKYNKGFSDHLPLIAKFF